MNDKEEFQVNFGSGASIDLDEVRRRSTAVMPDGEHAWVIHAVYAVEDPELAMDNMELGAEQFVGVTDIHCLLCHVHYDTKIRHFKCPQKVSTTP